MPPCHPSMSPTGTIASATSRGAGAGDPYVAPVPARNYLDEVSAKPQKLRIAWTKLAPNGAKVDPECVRLLEETARLCGELGHVVEERNPEVEGNAIVPTFLTLASANTVVNLASHPTAGRPAQEGEVERITWLTAKMGEKLSAPIPRISSTAAEPEPCAVNAGADRVRSAELTIFCCAT